MGMKSKYLKYSLRALISSLVVIAIFQLVLVIAYSAFGIADSWNIESASLVGSAVLLFIKSNLWICIYSVLLKRMSLYSSIPKATAKTIFTLTILSVLIDILNTSLADHFPRSHEINWVSLSLELKEANPILSSVLELYGNNHVFLSNFVELITPVPYGAASLAFGLLPFYFLSGQSCVTK